MPAETKYVFLDVQVFRDQDLDFFSPNFKRLIRLAAVGELQLILTYVTEQETRKRITLHAKDAFRQAKSFKKVDRIVKNLLTPEGFKALDETDEGKLLAGMQEEFARFLLVTNAKILPIDDIPPKAVFERYFRAKPPFSESGDKKSEFPDAFAAAALQKWCEEVPGRKLFVVSLDRDWRLTCKEVKRFIHIRKLDELLEKFADSEVVADLKEAINARSDDLVSLLKGKIEGGSVYFYADDSALEGEVDHVEDVDIEIEDVHVVEAKDGLAALSLVCNVKVTLFVSADDPDSSYTDPDNGERRSVWTLSGSVEREIEMDATVEITYDVKDPKNIEITSATFQDEGISISIENGELTPNYDDDEPDIYGPDDEEPERTDDEGK
jgi:hypothetical protein